MKPPLSPAERDRLRAIAALVDIEAINFEDGFRVMRDGVPTWLPDEGWAQVRAIRLRSAAAFLRKLASRKGAGATDAPAPPAGFSETCTRPSGCRCAPRCQVCGFGPHAAVHLPPHGAPEGSPAYDHQHQP